MASVLRDQGLNNLTNVIQGGGSQLLVAWKALAAATDPDDPFETADLANCNVLAVPNSARFVEAYVFHNNSSAISAGALAAFGWVSPDTKNVDTPFRVLPAAFDDPYEEADLLVSGLKPGGYFIPLYNQGSGNHLLTVNTTSEIQKPASGGGDAALGVSGGNLYWTVSGCSHVILFPSTTIAGPSAGLVCARFLS